MRSYLAGKHIFTLATLNLQVVIEEQMTADEVILEDGSSHTLNAMGNIAHDRENAIWCHCRDACMVLEFFGVPCETTHLVRLLTLNPISLTNPTLKHVHFIFRCPRIPDQLVFPLVVIFHNHNTEYHMILMCTDKQRKTCTFYDPSDYPEIRNALIPLFQSQPLLDLAFVPPPVTPLDRTLQSCLEHGAERAYPEHRSGYCAVVCFMVLLLCYVHEEFDIHTVAEMAEELLCSQTNRQRSLFCPPWFPPPMTVDDTAKSVPFTGEHPPLSEC